MNVYDQAARFAAKLDPGGFLRWLLAGFDPDLTFTRWLETQTIPFPGEPDRRCDTVAELVPASGLAPPWAAVIEFQTRPDTDIRTVCWSIWGGWDASCVMARTGVIDTCSRRPWST